MSELLAPSLFFALVIGVFTVPFIPVLREIRLKRDIAPLNVDPDYRSDALHFAHRFHDLVARRADRMAAGTMSPIEGVYEGELHLLVPAGHRVEDAHPRGGDERLILGNGDLHIAGGRFHRREIYSRGDLVIERDTQCRAALSDGVLLLEPGTSMLRWVHARAELRAEAGARLHGRATSDEAIVLDSRVRFERLHAPEIRFGTPGGLQLPPTGDLQRLDPHQLPGLVDLSAGRALVDAHLELPDRCRLGVDLVVLGDLKIGRECKLEGSIKTHGKLELGEGSLVRASLVSERDITVGPDAQVEGPVLAGRRLILGPRSTIGTGERPTTVRGETIQMHAGATVHGSLWASRGGEAVA